MANNKSNKITQLVMNLEKLTGKKVMLEFVTEPSTLSKRQIGANSAIEKKGFDNWTEGQYALAYYIVIFGQKKLPQPFNAMSLDQLAEDAGVKPNSLAMCLSRIKFLAFGEGLETGGPKVEGFMDKFKNMKQEDLAQLVTTAMKNSIPGKDINGHKHADFAKKKVVTSGPDMSRDKINLINKDRAAKGLRPLVLRGNRLVSEHFNKNGFILIENQLADIKKNDKDTKIIEAIVVNSNGDEAVENKITEAIAKKITDPQDMLSKYVSAKILKKENISKIFYAEAETLIKNKIITESINKLKKITNSEIELNEAGQSLNKEQLNEWFARGAYKKFVRMLDRAVKQVDNLNSMSRLYPQKWNGDEVQKIKSKLTSIFQTFTSDNKHLVRPETNKMVEESIKLDEYFAKGAYNKLLDTLDACNKQAKKFNQYMDFYPEELTVDTKMILAKIKMIWKLFNQGAAAGGNMTAAADDVNKLSHKAPRGLKGMTSKDQQALEIQKQEIVRQKNNPQAAQAHIDAYNNIASKYGMKPIDPKKIFGSNYAATPSAQPAQNTPVQPEEKKDKSSFSKRMLDRMGKLFGEAIEMDDNELNEIFGFSKKEKGNSELKNQIQQAKNEIQNFKITTLLGQESTGDEKIRHNIIAYRLGDAKKAMPVFTQLVPKLFNDTHNHPIYYKDEMGHKGDYFMPRSFYSIATKYGYISKDTFVHNADKLLDVLANRN